MVREKPGASGSEKCYGTRCVAVFALNEPATQLKGNGLAYGCQVSHETIRSKSWALLVHC